MDPERFPVSVLLAGIEELVTCESPSADLAAVARSAQTMAARVSDRLGADGVNLLNSCGSAAWQTVFHFHVHVIPRYDTDPLRLPWVPGPGDRDEIAAAARQLTG